MPRFRFFRSLQAVALACCVLASSVPLMATVRSCKIGTGSGGELADARRMGDSGIYEYFKGVSAGIKPKP